jgi:hypothetical protein
MHHSPYIVLTWHLLLLLLHIMSSPPRHCWSQIRWSSSATAALPLGQELCARRLAFFKRKPKIKIFVENLQAQVGVAGVF